MTEDYNDFIAQERTHRRIMLAALSGLAVFWVLVIVGAVVLFAF